MRKRQQSAVKGIENVKEKELVKENEKIKEIEEPVNRSFVSFMYFGIFVIWKAGAALLQSSSMVFGSSTEICF